MIILCKRAAVDFTRGIVLRTCCSIHLYIVRIRAHSDALCGLAGFDAESAKLLVQGSRLLGLSELIAGHDLERPLERDLAEGRFFQAVPGFYGEINLPLAGRPSVGHIGLVEMWPSG